MTAQPPKLDSAQLAAVYPTPKTYDELREAQQERENRRRLARPKYIPLKAALLMTGLVLAVLAFIAAAPEVMFAGAGITGVSALFLIGLFLMLCAWLIYRRINHWYDDYGANSRVFLVEYAILLGICALANYVVTTLWHQELLVIGLVHFVGVFIFVWATLRRSK